MSNLYRERAAECMKLSMISCDTAIREGYRKLAETYLKLANGTEAKQEPPNLSIKAHCGSHLVPSTRVRLNAATLPPFAPTPSCHGEC
jgi:hypothetical protein